MKTPTSYPGLIEAEALPLAVSDRVAEIATEAAHACFAEIANQLDALGYPVTGDFAPDEVARMDHIFQGFVLAMALNNPKIGAMNND